MPPAGFPLLLKQEGIPIVIGKGNARGEKAWAFRRRRIGYAIIYLYHDDGKFQHETLCN
jgi:hypothetical protein